MKRPVLIALATAVGLVVAAAVVFVLVKPHGSSAGTAVRAASQSSTAVAGNAATGGAPAVTTGTNEASGGAAGAGGVAAASSGKAIGATRSAKVSAVGAAAPASAELADLIQRAGLQALKPGVKSVDFRLANLEGSTVALSSYHGKVVLLNFWATWCPPCRAEIPSLESLYTKFKGKGFVVLGVDLQESPQAVKDFVSQNKITYPVLLDQSGQVGATYGARGIPLTFLIDRNGEVTSGIVGGHEWANPENESLISALLAKS